MKGLTEEGPDQPHKTVVQEKTLKNEAEEGPPQNGHFHEKEGHSTKKIDGIDRGGKIRAQARQNQNFRKPNHDTKIY